MDCLNSASLDAWIARVPEQEMAYLRWLSTLAFLDRRAEADTWVRDRLATELTAESSQSDRAALGAAIQFALGHGWNYRNIRIDEQWLAPLTELAHRLIRLDHSGWYYASRILQDGRLQQTDEYAAMNGDVSSRLVLSPQP